MWKSCSRLPAALIATSTSVPVRTVWPTSMQQPIRSSMFLTASSTVCGDGKIPVPGMFKLLRQMKYKGNVNLEYEINLKDPLPGMVKSFAYMRGVLAGLQA